MRKSILGRLLAVLLVASGLAQFCRADEPRTPGGLKIQDFLGHQGSSGLLGHAAADQKPIIRVGLTPSTAKKGDIVTLSVTVVLPSDAHTYSTSPEIPGATRIDVTDALGLQAKGDFEPDHSPTVVKDEATNRLIEEFQGGATWLRQYLVTADHPETVRVSGSIDLKYCNDSACRPFTQKFRASLVPNGSAEASTGAGADTTLADAGTDPQTAPAAFSQVIAPNSFGGQTGHVKLTFQLKPAKPAKPGDIVTFSVTMELDPAWHAYSTTQKDGPGATPTVIKLKAGNGLHPIGTEFKPDREPEFTAKSTELGPKEVYHGQVTWTRRFKFEPKPGAGGIGISGSIHYGVCNEALCLPPKTVSFELGEVKGASPLPEPLPDDTPKVSAASASEGSLWFYLGGAFLGGILLNVMPCVLPVLAIKILSFVQQAGESRSRIFLLNVAYTVGVLAVFLTLATLAVGTQLGLSFAGDFSWGGLFQHKGFNLVMACIVFAMGLSLLGVFEIPVPGVVGSAAGQNQKEGSLGAFLTGIFATLLATPCLGPFMAPALGWSIRQAPHVVYLVWGVCGLGMAFPYLLVGLFPSLIKWLPKPGNWMIRFKEFAGFLLLGSVIFIIYYTDKRFTVPLLVMLLGIALGLWMIGNLYDINSHIRHKWSVRIAAVLLTVGICWGGYGLAGESKYSLDWQPFSESRIAALMKDNKTVLVDFTADWCLNCHFNEAWALNTRATQELVKKHGIVTLKADFTEESPEIRRWLLKFKQDGVPLTVIIPAGREDEAIVLDGTYSQGTLLKSLHKAVQPMPPSARAEVNAAVIR